MLRELLTGGCGKVIDNSVDEKYSRHSFVTFWILPNLWAKKCIFLVDMIVAGIRRFWALASNSVSVDIGQEGCYIIYDRVDK